MRSATNTMSMNGMKFIDSEMEDMDKMLCTWINDQTQHSKHPCFNDHCCTDMTCFITATNKAHQCQLTVKVQKKFGTYLTNLCT